MTKKLKLTKIELETKDGTKIKLSIEEAKDMHDQLHELFGEKYIPSAPIIINERWPYRPGYPYWTTFTSDAGEGTSMLKSEGQSGMSMTFSGSSVDE